MSVSPTINLSSVVLPAPLAPTMATRLASVTMQHALVSCGVVAEGYLKVTPVIFITVLVRLRMPSSFPGSGKTMGKKPSPARDCCTTGSAGSAAAGPAAEASLDLAPSMGVTAVAAAAAGGVVPLINPEQGNGRSSAPPLVASEFRINSLVGGANSTPELMKTRPRADTVDGSHRPYSVPASAPASSGWRWFGWGAASTPNVEKGEGFARRTTQSNSSNSPKSGSAASSSTGGVRSSSSVPSDLARQMNLNSPPQPRTPGGPSPSHKDSAGYQEKAYRRKPSRSGICIRLNSEQLDSLWLRPGANTITFSVHSGLQGTQVVKAAIYKWKHWSKIVISDVDGTITKSDVLGHVMPRVGIDWSHSGVTALYTMMEKQGYHLLYLTSRGIGQSLSTREYLTGVQQGKTTKTTLPEGPIFMSPTRLIESFTREVIWRNPEEFKRACLEDIRSLFPDGFNPYYAGFGNRSSDETAYRAVGVPESRILIINPQGIITHGNKTYQKSYPMLLELASHMFPSITNQHSHASQEAETFNSFNYWRMPPSAWPETPSDSEPEDEDDRMADATYGSV
mmetsp:Transcript_42141/g.103922  ORF Transcript_42141/g.103922 Transcript_42141/m.103922 type:complete len:566 (+) Transcript_42141:1184-2881(+)